MQNGLGASFVLASMLLLSHGQYASLSYYSIIKSIRKVKKINDDLVFSVWQGLEPINFSVQHICQSLCSNLIHFSCRNKNHRKINSKIETDQEKNMMNQQLA